jgi:molybdopterin-guanine dinucleotide biosynthesis protein A
LVALIAAYVAAQRPADILFLVSASFSLAGSAFVPVMILGIFWRGVTRVAAVAGMLTGLQHCATEWLLCVPCDSPFFPLDLAYRLGMAVDAEQSTMAVAWAPEVDAQRDMVCRPQPVFCLLHRSLQTSLRDFLHTGGRKIDAWTTQNANARMDFNLPHDTRHAFANANTWQELKDLEG